MPRVLHLLSQRPSLTGSGVTLDALVRSAAAAGWTQAAVVGVASKDRAPRFTDLAADRVFPLCFETGDLDFPIPGMSDVMPYPSTRFSDMSPTRLDRYREAWEMHLRAVIGAFRPDLIHSHHIWIMSSMLSRIAPGIPVVNHCHATGLRQMRLCPHLADEVRRGCARNDRFAVLHRDHALQLAQVLDLVPTRVRVVGAGYREEIFQPGESLTDRGKRLVYVGKYSAAKGLPWLLDAFERLARQRPDLELHVVGDGAGDEAEALRRRMSGMSPRVVRHGILDQPRLAELLRTCSVCALPSFYEGLPLVLVEAAACGCRLVATRLAGVEEQLAEPLRPILELVPLPRIDGVDRPRQADLPEFVERLTATLGRALDSATSGTESAPPRSALEPFTWSAVFRRVEAIWLELVR